MIVKNEKILKCPIQCFNKKEECNNTKRDFLECDFLKSLVSTECTRILKLKTKKRIYVCNAEPFCTMTNDRRIKMGCVK
jgi:hypothetical protein